VLPHEAGEGLIVAPTKLGLFMISACVFVTALEHPMSPVHRAIPSALLRRVLTGIAMGFTAIGLIYSPWGQRSGAHMNPSLTLTYLHLGKIAPSDALCYVLSHFMGGLSGVLVARALLGNAVADPAVRFAITVPGPGGPLAAFIRVTAPLARPGFLAAGVLVFAFTLGDLATAQVLLPFNLYTLGTEFQANSSSVAFAAAAPFAAVLIGLAVVAAYVVMTRFGEVRALAED